MSAANDALREMHAETAAMEADMLAHLFPRALLTGSVAFGAPAPKDVDFLVGQVTLDTLPHRAALVDSCPGREEYPDDTFHTYRFARLNLIVSDDKTFREAWMAAHNRCVLNPPEDKAGRIAVFQEERDRRGLVT